MIDHLLENSGGDWIEDVADALPMTVIGDIIGIPDQDRPQIFGILRPHPDGAAHPRHRLTRQAEVDLFATIFGYAMELTEQKRRARPTTSGARWRPP